MKNLFRAQALIVVCLLCLGCDKVKDIGELRFVISADYPPFTLVKDGEFAGFEVDLARAIAEDLGLRASFQDIPFSGITAVLANDQADAAISAIAKTTERAKNFDFSDIYYTSDDKLAVVVRKGTTAVHVFSDLGGKKILCQLGSVMEMIVNDEIRSGNLHADSHSMDSIPQIIESIKSEQFDVAVIEVKQAAALVEKNANLTYYIIEAKNESGYRIMVKKDADCLKKINESIARLRDNGTIEKLSKKWFKK